MELMNPKGRPCIVYSNSNKKKFCQSPCKFGSSDVELIATAYFFGLSSCLVDALILSHRFIILYYITQHTKKITIHRAPRDSQRLVSVVKKQNNKTSDKIFQEYAYTYYEKIISRVENHGIGTARTNALNILHYREPKNIVCV